MKLRREREKKVKKSKNYLDNKIFNKKEDVERELMGLNNWVILYIT